jgi:CheY-like chemotaxis protein
MIKKICMVEDTQDLLDNITTLMSLEGFDVLPCSNGAMALEKLKNFTPDLIITDLWMPVMDGFAFIEEARRVPALAAVPIMVFSAAPLKPAERDALDKRIVRFITKPVTAEDFLEAVNLFFANSE